MSYIKTLTGAFTYREISPHNIQLADICRSLSRQPRWLGYTSQFYSIGRHSLLVGMMAKELAQAAGESPAAVRNVALCGALHDATEAYLADVPSPVKGLPELAGYRLMESRILEAVGSRFSLNLQYPVRTEGQPVLPVHVLQADKAMLVVEAINLMGFTEEQVKDWGNYNKAWASAVLEPRSMTEVERDLMEFVSVHSSNDG